jgi:hypothetical protein
LNPGGTLPPFAQEGNMNKHELEQLFDTVPEDALVSVTHDLRSRGLLESVADSIACQLEARCRASLSPRQRWRFLHDAWLDHVEGECNRCGSTLLSEEMVDAAEVTGGLCSWCWHQWQKILSA